MIVFLASGLWHGASFSFIIWGGINGLYQVASESIKPLRDKAVSALKLNRTSLGHRIASIFCTFVLVDFAWIFFRADGFKGAVDIIRLMFEVRNPWILFDGELYTCGLDEKNFRLMIVAVMVLMFADCCKAKGIRIRDTVIRQDYWFRWLFIAVSVATILTFGIWGPNYNAANFIYFQF
jgi:D-alanyl-lipoteichoic acid acyltransferase DltB (MBOAT superfamily)